ncbi:MAG TPA: delta-60 repeat domain-containing protein [Solirubrobacteraceae bacterium]|jgi:uncharacterized delta-60 repeat protein
MTSPRQLVLACLLLALAFAPAAAAAPADLDAGFGDGGIVVDHFGGESLSTYLGELALQPDGKVLAAGTANQELAIARYRADGMPDSEFSDDGKATVSFAAGGYSSVGAMRVLPDGRILLVGIGASASKIAVARLRPDGSPDPTLNGDGNADGKLLIDLPGSSREALSSLVLLPDGRAWGLGSYRPASGKDQVLLARLKANGALDKTYSDDGWDITSFDGAPDTTPADLVALSGGGLLAGGDLDEAGPPEVNRAWLLRFTPEGELDPAYDGDGRFVPDLGPSDIDAITTLVPGLRGGFLAGGYTGDNGVVLRLRPDGTPDTQFGAGGLQVLSNQHGGSSEYVAGLGVQADDRPVLFDTWPAKDGTLSQMVVRRLTATGADDTSFAPSGLRDVPVEGATELVAMRTIVQPDGKLLLLGLRNDGPQRTVLARLMGSPPDRDADGVPDAADACPDAAGSLGNGCAPPPPNPFTPPSITPTIDTVKPTLSGARVTRTKFRVGSKRTAKEAKAKKGTTFAYTLSEQATVTISLHRLVKGRRAGGKCRTTRKRGKRCTKRVKAGTLVRRDLAAGAQRTPFSGRLGSKRLKTGRYRAKLVAVDAAGNRSRAVTLRFRVVKR